MTRGQSDDINPDAAVAPGFLTNHAARVFNRLVDTRLRQHGLTIALLNPLLVLAWRGAMTQRDLVRHSAVKQPAMAALLDKLEGMSLIERDILTTDRRAATVNLTEHGHATAATGKEVLRAINAEAVRGLSDTERRMLLGTLARLIANLEDLPER